MAIRCWTIQTRVPVHRVSRHVDGVRHSYHAHQVARWSPRLARKLVSGVLLGSTAMAGTGAGLGLAAGVWLNPLAGQPVPLVFEAPRLAAGASSRTPVIAVPEPSTLSTVALGIGLTAIAASSTRKTRGS